jgi:hypothetical protein
MLLCAILGLILLKTTTSPSAKVKIFPYLYLSANDNATYYVDVTRYIPMDYLIDPEISTTSSELAIFQPFQQAPVKTDAVKSKLAKSSFSNCTAASASTQGYAAMICDYNTFILISVDQVVAVDKFYSNDSPCSPGGDLICQNVVFDEQITAGFVVCLKNNTQSVSVVTYAFQFISGISTLAKSSICTQISNTTKEESGAQTIKSSIIGVQYLDGSVPNLQVANVSIIIKPYSEDKSANVFDSSLKQIITLQLKKTSVTVLDSSSGLHKITDLITQGFHLVKIHCTTGFRFQYLFKANCMFVTSLQNGLGSSQTSEVYFLNISTSSLDGYFLVKKVSIDFDLLTEVHVDDVYFLSSSFNLTDDAFGTATLVLIDIYSVYSETFDQQSALIYETLTFDIGFPSSSTLTPAPLDPTAAANTTTAVNSRLQANSRSAVVDFAFTDGRSVAAVIDLDAMAVVRRDTSGLRVDRVALAVSGDEPLCYFNVLLPGADSFILEKTSNSKAFVAIPAIASLKFSYYFTLLSAQSSSSVIQNFYLNGTFIDMMGNFIEIRSEFFRQNFTYYANLDYNFYLPWENVRGADITLKDREDEHESPSMTSFKYFNQSIVLRNSNINTPESYFICDEYLVILDKNVTGNSFTIMIFKLRYQNDQSLVYDSVNNQTYNPGPGVMISFSDTSLRTVKVYYSNIICLLAIHTYSGQGPRRTDYYSMRLFGYFGQNYLTSYFEVKTDSLSVDGNLQLQNQTSCIFVISTSVANAAPVVNPYLTVWRINPEDLGKVSLLATFKPDSNIQPTFCPIAINQDLIDSRYIIVKSWCGGQAPTYSMKLDIETLQVSEFLNDRLIDKTGDICPSRASFVKVYQGQLTGYTSSAGKGIVNKVSYFVGDLDLNQPYDKKCFINQNLLVIGQRKVSQEGPSYAVYFFHTDRDFEADKRLDQRITIPGNVGVVTIYSTDSGAHVQYTIAESNELGRITVQLSKTTIVTSLKRESEESWPFNTSIFFEFLSRGNTTAVERMQLQYEQPMYSPVLKKITDREINPSALNGTLLDQVTQIDGPIFRIDLIYAGTAEEPPLSMFPYIEDLFAEGKVIIRAPIFSSFDLFKSAGAFVVGIVNYPYGFDVCVYDKNYLQDPVVSSFLGIVAVNAQVSPIGDTIFLVIHGNPIGDSSVGLFTYRANTVDLVFEPAGKLA